MHVKHVGHLPGANDRQIGPAMTARDGRIQELCEFRDRMTTRRLFVSWRILEIMEQRIVPATEMADRVSRLLGHDVTAEEWWEWLSHGVHEANVVRALARVLHADPDWLANGMI